MNTPEPPSVRRPCRGKDCDAVLVVPLVGLPDKITYAHGGEHRRLVVCPACGLEQWVSYRPGEAK